MSERSSPNVVFVVCDTLRPDYLSCYDGRVSTPNVDSVADRGTVFERAFGAGPGSSIAHGAIFSGQYPSNSGIAGQVDVPADVPLLAEHLRAAGYHTFGMPGPARISSEWGYDRGFDEYLEKWWDIPSSPTLSDLKLGLSDPTVLRPMPREFLRSALRGYDKHTSYLIDVFKEKIKRDLDRPFFAFANFPTVHAPYDPPRPYKERATPELDRPRWGFLERFFGDETLEKAGVRSERVYEAQTATGDTKYFADPDWLNEAELQVLRDWYAASVEYLDDQLGKLFEYLEASGLAEETVVIVAADHGEHIGEHGLMKHMYSHFEQCLHVPLVMAGPGVPEGDRRPEFVSLVDLFDTVCDLTGVEPPEATDGRSVFGDDPRDAAVAENGIREVADHFDDYMSPELVERFERGVKSIRTDDYLLTVDSAGEEALYERPGETPVEDPDAEVVSRLRERMYDELGREFGVGYQQEQLSDEVERNLRELGYIS